MIILLAALALLACSEARGQSDTLRYYDFDFLADYRSYDIGTDYSYSYPGHTDSKLEQDGVSRRLYLIRYAYEGGRRLPTDTLSSLLSHSQLDSLFTLAAQLFDLGDAQNLAANQIPPPPPVYHGYVVELRFDLGYRGRDYSTTFILLGDDRSPEHALDGYLRMLIPPLR